MFELQEIQFQLTNRHKHLGLQKCDDGAILIANITSIGTHAWLHEFFPALSTDQIERLQSLLSIPIPSDYIQLLQHNNGMSLFSGHLHLDGFRQRSTRNIEDAWQPFSLATYNEHERPSRSKKDDFFIGGYGTDGSKLFIDKNDQVVHCSKSGSKRRKTWNCLNEFLREEIERISLLYDNDGICEGRDIYFNRST